MVFPRRARPESVGRILYACLVEYAAIDALRDRHPAWRLLRAGNSTLILSFLGLFFVEGNRGACPACCSRPPQLPFYYVPNDPVPAGHESLCGG